MAAPEHAGLLESGTASSAVHDFPEQSPCEDSVLTVTCCMSGAQVDPQLWQTHLRSHARQHRSLGCNPTARQAAWCRRRHGPLGHVDKRLYWVRADHPGSSKSQAVRDLTPRCAMSQNPYSVIQIGITVH